MAAAAAAAAPAAASCDGGAGGRGAAAAPRELLRAVRGRQQAERAADLGPAHRGQELLYRQASASGKLALVLGDNEANRDHSNVSS